MSKMILLILFFLNSHAVSDLPSISEVRTLYQKAATSKSNCEELLNRLASCNKNTHTLYYGYKGSATMMMAQYVSNPFTKLSYFKRGKKMLEAAIATDKNNIELRFLRLAVQQKAPAFLGYKHSIDADKTFLLNAVPAITDQTLKNTIIEYLKVSGYSIATPANKNEHGRRSAHSSR